MAHCLACDNDVTPIVEMGTNLKSIHVCPRDECRAVFAPPAPTEQPIPVEQQAQHPEGVSKHGPGGPTRLAGPARTTDAGPLKITLKDPAAFTGDLVTYAEARIAVLDGEIARLESFKRERRRLAAMVAAAKAADGEADDLPIAAE